MKQIVIPNVMDMKHICEQTFESKSVNVTAGSTQDFTSSIRWQNAVNRYKGEGIQNLIIMEEFDDVKTLDQEIDKLNEQVKELSRCVVLF